MNDSKTTLDFRKTAACPASATLLSFRAKSLSVPVADIVQQHLAMCDFCNAELPLLAHHRAVTRSYKAPEMPMDLRILAESILCQVKS